jgi:beta-glucuronidase
MDASRLVTFVVDSEAADNRAFEDADLVAVNIYRGQFSEPVAHHIGELDELVRKASETAIRRQMAAFPDKPLVVTEFGTRGVPGIHGDIDYTEDFQAAFIRSAWQAIRNVEGVSGGVLWCWADYFHRRDFIQYAPYGPYGVVTVDRKPKAALRALAEMYGGSVDEPVSARRRKQP